MVHVLEEAPASTTCFKKKGKASFLYMEEKKMGIKLET
jgi:hypothetical protein